jgi:hypothetical protein
MATSRPSTALGTIAELTARDLLPVVRDVCRQHGVTLEEVCGTLCSWSIARARHEAWWRVRHHPERHYSISDVGRIFGRSAATIQYGIRVHARRRAITANKSEVSHDAVLLDPSELIAIDGSGSQLKEATECAAIRAKTRTARLKA